MDGAHRVSKRVSRVDLRVSLLRRLASTTGASGSGTLIRLGFDMDSLANSSASASTVAPAHDQEQMCSGGEPGHPAEIHCDGMPPCAGCQPEEDPQSRSHHQQLPPAPGRSLTARRILSQKNGRDPARFEAGGGCTPAPWPSSSKLVRTEAARRDPAPSIRQLPGRPTRGTRASWCSGKRRGDVWAILGNARREPWEIWHSWQRGICKLQIPGAYPGFESHPHRHLMENNRLRSDSWLASSLVCTPISLKTRWPQ